MYGMCRVTVSEELKIQKIEAYFDPETFIQALEGKVKPEELKAGKVILGDVECPFVNKDTKWFSQLLPFSLFMPYIISLLFNSK